VAGQVVAAGSAGGSIYDLGYRRYLGARLGRRHAFASLGRHSFRMAYGLGRPARAKVIPVGLLVLAILPAVVALGVAAIASRAGGGELGDISPIKYSSYYSYIGPLVSLFTAAQAPELLGRDLRFRVLALYFTRSLRREDYALAKEAALFLALLAVLLVPQALIFVGRALASRDILGSLEADLPEVLPVIAFGLLTAGVLAALGLSIAAFSPRRAYATIGIIAVLIVPPLVVASTARIAGDDLAGPLTLLSPPDTLVGTNAWLFGIPAPELVGTIPLGVYPLAAVGWIVACTAILAWRYRTVEP
jgi:ABC-2 type transport system permease protein